jgi:hypothetical protein
MEQKQLLDLARLGALARLAEIHQEREFIMREFPDLGDILDIDGAKPQRRRAAPNAGDNGHPDKPRKRRKKRGLAGGSREGHSRVMKAVWARRKAEDRHTIDD